MSKVKVLIAAAVIGMAASPVFAVEADAVAGETVFKKCAVCHNVDEAKNKVGPHLVGIVDRPVASIADFKYSPAMIEFGAGGKVWDEATLAEYLANPRAVVKGTRMAFAGLKKEEDLANVIAYIKSIPVK